MALALLKSGGKDDRVASGHPLRARLRAWWEGNELPPMEATDFVNPESPASPGAQAEEGSPADTPDWSPAWQQLVQLIWGEGFNGPGGEEHVLEMAKPFGLTNQNTLLEIGSGLGGGACVIVDKIKAYVDGLDFDPNLVDHAVAIAILKGFDAKAKFRLVEPGAPGVKPGFYDGCFLHDTFMAVEDKEGLLETAVGAIKPGKSIVIAEIFTGTPEPGKVAAASLSMEHGDIFPCDAARIVAKLKSMNVEIRIDTDKTKNCAAMARSVWSGVAGRLARKQMDEETADALLYETEFWARRHEAYESGELKMRRIVAIKSSDAL